MQMISLTDATKGHRNNLCVSSYAESSNLQSFASLLQSNLDDRCKSRKIKEKSRTRSSTGLIGKIQVGCVCFRTLFNKNCLFHDISPLVNIREGTHIGCLTDVSGGSF